MSAYKRIKRMRRAAGSERGFTIVEVLVAVVILSIGLLAVLGPLESAGLTTRTAERNDQAVSYGQREIERLRTLSYSDLGHASLPSHEGSGAEVGDNNPTNPNFYVQNQADGSRTLLIKENYRDSTSATRAPAGGETLVPGGTALSQERFSVAGTAGTVHRYISWRRESCTNCNLTAANGQNSKRVTLAVVPDAAGNGAGASKPVWLSTVVTDPSARPPGTQAPTANPGSGTAVSGQPFFLHDVRCKTGYGQGDQPAQKPSTHPTYNSSEEGKTCADDDSPHSLDNVSPRDTNPYPPLEDYSSELTRTAPLGGLVVKPFSTGCPTSYSATALAATPALKQSIHTWATPRMNQLLPSDFKTPTTGARSALSFFTQTVNGASGGATLCLSLRHSGQASSASSLASYAYTQANWPRTPTELSFAFDHQAFTVPADRRLYLTVSVQSDSPNDIALLYDHPAYRSALTVSTTTPVSGG